MDPPRRAARPAAALIALAVLATACGTSSSTVPAAATASPTAGSANPAPSATVTPSPDPATVYAAIESEVQQLRHLTATSTVEPTLLDEAALKRNMSAAFDKSNPPEIVAASQRLYELLGLIPSGVSLRDLYVKLLGSQVAGYYDSDTKQLYVVSKSGAVGALEKSIFAHEYDHALQDQNFGLANLDLESVGHGDTTLAHQAVAEGDATLLMTIWAQSNLSTSELVDLARSASDPEAAQTLAEMPDILRETLTFPYTSGAQLVVAAQAAGGGWPGVDALYKKLPASTEQVLHPEKYTASEAPVAVSFPKDLAARLGPGWKVAMSDTLGEFQLGVWLRSVGAVPAATATTASAGWGGDRVALVEHGDRAGAVLDTRWDSPADAVEFAAAAQQTLDRLGGHHAMIAIDGTDRVTLFVATDDATISALAGVLGLAG